MRSPHSEGASLDPEYRKAYQRQFAQLSTALRRQVIELIQAWRTTLNAALWFEEVAGLDRHSQSELIDAWDLDDMAAFFISAAETWPELNELSVGTAAWIGRLAERLPDSAGEDPKIREAVHKIYELVRPHGANTVVTGWYDPSQKLPSSQSAYTVELRQVGDQLVANKVDMTTPWEPLNRIGSPLALLQTANGEVKVSASREEPFWRTGTPPEWADRWGYDRYGPWVTFRIGDIEQRLRWIWPGRFYMGSTEEEEGHEEEYDGPRHEVELTQGYWLFDTPCTQALWEAVMDENPSRFKGRHRPVETVSWADCQGFITKVNEEHPGLHLRLPTEAQWEYACRGRTQTARYDADVDAIAWYENNSEDESHDVGEKKANAWGLYDMLGNVFEWCLDGRRNYETGLMVDPVGPTEADAHRVVRGGAWLNPVRHVRAADRYWYDPGLRRSHLGFRCLSSGSETGHDEP